MAILKRLLGLIDHLTPTEEKTEAQQRLAKLELAVALLRVERDSLRD